MMQSFVLTIKKSPLLQGISWVFLSTSIASLLRFLLVFVVLHCYNQEQFGLWASITSIGAIIVTGDFGLTNVLRNIASKNLSRGKEGDDETKRYFFSTLYFFFFLALVLTLLLLLFNNAIPFVKPIDKEQLINILNKHPDGLITIEEHQKSCGMGSAIIEILNDFYSDGLIEKYPTVNRIAIPDEFVDVVQTQSYLREYENLNLI